MSPILNLDFLYSISGLLYRLDKNMDVLVMPWYQIFEQFFPEFSNVPK